MIRERTRPQWTPEQLKDIYQGPHDARVLYPGHLPRVTRTIAMANRICPNPESVADLACGNGDIANGCGATRTYLGDFAAGFEFQGPVEETIDLIPEVTLMVAAETLEHLWDPDAVLLRFREKAQYLVCSVPVTPEEGQNGEHYWSFDREGFESLLADTGWEVIDYEEVTAAPSVVFDTYQAGIWGCRRA